MTWTDVAALKDIPQGLSRIEVGNVPFVLVRRGDAVYACDAVCPHKFADLSEGTLDGDHLTCPVHEGTFNVTTGSPLTECAWAGRLSTFPVRIRDGRVHLDL